MYAGVSNYDFVDCVVAASDEVWECFRSRTKQKVKIKLVQRTGTDIQDRKEDWNWRPKFSPWAAIIGFTFYPCEWLGVSIPDMEIEFTGEDTLHPRVTFLVISYSVLCTLRHFSLLPKHYSGKKYIFCFSLLVLISTKLAQGLLVVFCCMFCIFRFLVSNKNAELFHVFFVYFVGFVIRFIFATKVVYLLGISKPSI